MALAMGNSNKMKEVIELVEKYVDLSGISRFLDNSKKIFANISHMHVCHDIVDLENYSNTILQTVYPVCSIYISTTNTNPSTLFGFGSWEQITDKFLLAAGNTYAAGETGGEASHTLTTSEIPSHKHTGTTSTAGAHTHQIGTDKDVDYLAAGDCWSVHNASSGATYTNGYTTSAGDHEHTVTISNTGGGQSHNNMPPYLAVYVWKRIS